MTRRAVLLFCALLGVGPAPAAAQSARTAIVPERITVGDVFHAAVRIEVPRNVRVTFPDTMNVPENVEAAARRELTIDTTAADRLTFTAVYALTAWRVGSIDMPASAVRIEGPDSAWTIDATFARIFVESVLPADSAGIDPKPAKDVLGPSRLVWPVVLAAIAILALLVLAWKRWRRRRPEPLPGPGAPPREIALAELERIRKLGYIERGEWKLFYSAVSGVLRQYASAVEPAWSRDLTTPELDAAMRWHMRSADAAPDAEPRSGGADRLVALLGSADLVKFAASRPDRGDAEAAWKDSLGWIETFAWPPPEPEPAGATTEET